MHEIDQGRVWIGNAYDGRDSGSLFEREIQVVVDVAYEELPAALPRQLAYCRFPLIDGGGNSAAILHTAIATVSRLQQTGLRTLVCCSAGLSRSPAVAAAALAVRGEEAPEIWLERISQTRSLQVSSPLWNEVLAALERVRA